MKQEVKDKVVEWLNNSKWGFPQEDDTAGKFMFKELIEAAEFGYNLAQEEYAAQSKGMPSKGLDLKKMEEQIDKALAEETEESLNAFFNKCKTQSTQEGVTVDIKAIRDKWIYHTPLIPLPEVVDSAMTEYASQVSATDKKRIEELEKEVERLRGLVEKASNRGYYETAEDYADRVQSILK